MDGETGRTVLQSLSTMCKCALSITQPGRQLHILGATHSLAMQRLGTFASSWLSGCCSSPVPSRRVEHQVP